MVASTVFGAPLAIRPRRRSMAASLRPSRWSMMARSRARSWDAPFRRMARSIASSATVRRPKAKAARAWACQARRSLGFRRRLVWVLWRTSPKALRASKASKSGVSGDAGIGRRDFTLRTGGKFAQSICMSANRGHCSPRSAGFPPLIGFVPFTSVPIPFPLFQDLQHEDFHRLRYRRCCSRFSCFS